MARPLQIGLLLFPDCMPAGLLGFADLLHAANRRTGKALFQTHFVGVQAGTVTCNQGLVMQASHAINALAFDAILVPGFWAESAHDVETTLQSNATLVAALSRLPARCRIWSYCVGVSLVAATGRLDRQPATATWWLLDALIKQHPKVRWQSDSTCIFGAGNASASGVNGYLPIAQALIEQSVSPAILHELVTLMVLPRPTQTHNAFRAISLIQQPSPLLRQLHMAVEALPAEQIILSRLAEALCTSERTLARKVKKETGTAAASYVRRIKLAQAAERLTLTTVPLSTISTDLGFSSDSNLRRMFKELTQLTPAQYRQRFARY
jgi:transcriptional regulator GlxA family with amidase domain